MTNILTRKGWDSLPLETRRKWERRLRWWNVFWILIILSTCIDWTDIRVLEKSEETRHDKATMRVSVGPHVTDDERLAWVSRKCRGVMVLPPIEPVPIEMRRTEGKHDRTEYVYQCIRP